MDVDDCGHVTAFLHRFEIGAAPIDGHAGRQSAAPEQGNLVARAIVLVTNDLLRKGSAMTDVSQANGDTLEGGTNQTGTASGGTTAEKFKGQFQSFKGQATDKARDYAGKGVNRATDALDEAAKFLEDTARTIEEKLGPQYGRYGFSASESVSSFAEQLRGKDVDELVEDVRNLVRKSPAVAIGAAVGVGFVLARLAKAGAGFEDSSRGSALADTSGRVSAGSTPNAGTAIGSTGGPVGAPATSQAANQDSPITPTFPA
jgi:ElaB/YqjD/DUF883 family membrane-anchored ribosome-binding protein